MKARLTNRAFTARGFTLVELMVAMLIALIITFGVVQIFTANRATYQLDEGLARAQENGRFAIEFLAQDIRHAGYLGCNRDLKRESINEIKSREVTNFLVGIGGTKYAAQGIRGSEYTAVPTGIGNTYAAGAFPVGNAVAGWTPALDAALVTAAQPGSDVLVVERMSQNAWTLVAPYVTTTNVHLHPAFASQVKVNDILLVSDCVHAALFQVTDVTAAGVISHTVGSGTPGNRCGEWEGAEFLSGNAATDECDNANVDFKEPNSRLGTYQRIAYFVAQGPGPCGPPGSCQPTLFRSTAGPFGISNAQALVEGVENFQVLYGEDTNADGVADRYVTANNVSVLDFTRVVSVRIGLLVHGANTTGSSNDIAVDTDTHNVAGTIVDPADDKLRRRVFSTTLQLRNRGF